MATTCRTASPPIRRISTTARDAPIKREVILHDRLRAAVIDLNPDIPESAIDDALKQLCDKRQALSAIAANREVDGLIRDGVQVEFKDAQGRTRKERVKIIDFNNPAANQFLAVTQLWIQGERGYRRPDILLYVNGLPLVFIELKNSNVKLRTAYDDNLTNYKQDIPQLFLTNAFCVLSNAIETRVGSLTAEWEHFFHWLRAGGRKGEDRPRADRRRKAPAPERLLAGLCAQGQAARLHRELHPLSQGDPEDHRPEPPVHRREPGLTRPFCGRARAGRQARRLLAHPGLGQELFHDLLCPQDLPQVTGQLHLCGRHRPRGSRRPDLPQLPQYRHRQQGRGGPAQGQRGDAQLPGPEQAAGLHPDPEVPLAPRARTIRCSRTATTSS